MTSEPVAEDAGDMLFLSPGLSQQNLNVALGHSFKLWKVL